MFNLHIFIFFILTVLHNEHKIGFVLWELLSMFSWSVYCKKIKHMNNTFFSLFWLSCSGLSQFPFIMAFYTDLWFLFWLLLLRRKTQAAPPPPPPSLHFTLFNSHFSQRSRPALALEVDLCPFAFTDISPQRLCLTCSWEALTAVLFFFISRFTLASRSHPPPSQHPHTHAFPHS